jgi:hypothetical protein
MTTDQAKQILQLYRPGTADATDPTFAEALEACERDAELKQWFSNHCSLYAAIRAKFKKIPVPEGLKEQIIAERQVHRATPTWQKAVLVAGVVAMAALAIITFGPDFGPREPHDFAAYRDYMGSVAIRGYGMDKYSSDLDEIRTYLAEKKAIADYVLPTNLEKNVKALGCVATTWQGKPVTMVCFQTGRTVDPLNPNAPDLWLFISDKTIASGAPKASAPKFEKASELITANWTVGNRTYVLATKGDEQFLGKFLPTGAVL